MGEAVEEFLKAVGPRLSSAVADHLVANLGLTPAAARKRVSRLGDEVGRLGYVTFPRKARFLYLRQQFGSPAYWENLIDALLAANSAYGLAIAALRQRGGLIPQAHFSIACGSPLKQARHLSPDTVYHRLHQAGLVEKILVPGLGECVSLVQSEGHYDFLADMVRARLITEDVLLSAVRDWLRKLGLVSYNKVMTRAGDTLPTVGTFSWDLTAPSYLGFMMRADKEGKPKPGFVACDVCLGSEVGAAGIKPFLHKCVTLRRLRNVGSCMQIFVADSYSSEAFDLAKQHGVVPATPRALFGEEVAEGLNELTNVLSQAARMVIDPDKFDSLFKKLGKIEGASNQLRGTLFEYITAEVARKTISPDVKMNRVFKSSKGQFAEADVISVGNSIVTFIECKGYSPYGTIPDEYVKRWLQHNIPIFYEQAKLHPDWKNLEIRFEFWATGGMSDEAMHMFETAKKLIKASRYTVDLKLGPQILKSCKATKDAGLLIAFRKHYTKMVAQHPSPVVGNQGEVVGTLVN